MRAMCPASPYPDTSKERLNWGRPHQRSVKEAIRRIEVKATLQRCVTCFWPSHLLFAFPIKVAIKAAVQSWPRAYRVDTAYVTKAVLSRPVNKVVPQIQFVSPVKCVWARPNILCFDTKIQILYSVCIISLYFPKYTWLKNYSKHE